MIRAALLQVRAMAHRARWLPGGLSVAALAAALSVGAALPNDAQAMTVLAASVEDLVQTSEIVLHGKVRTVRVDDRRAKGRAVWTVYQFDVQDVWKGDRKGIGATFQLELLGGRTPDGMTLSVPGMPGFAAGEEAVLLLERHSEGHTLTGAPQGKWTVYRDSMNVARVVRPLADAHLVQRAPDGRLVEAAHDTRPLPLKPPAADTTLEQLRSQILGIVAAQAAAAPARAGVPGAKAPLQKAPRAMARPTVGRRQP